MLNKWHTHKEYQSYLIENIVPFFEADRKNVEQYKTALSKLYLLDLDPLLPLLAPYYSITGAPAKNQPELIRSFILMSELRIFSIPKWVKKLQSSDILCTMIGLNHNSIHNVGSYYDLINRVWLANPEIEYQFEHSTHNFKKKPRKKLGKNQKQPPRHPGIIQKFVDLALEDKTFESRPELLMQQIFAQIGVEPAAKENLYGDTQKLSVSGDGTCVKSGGCSYGKKVCNCDSFNCNCKRKFSDPYARWGWDSYHEQWYYGHTEYILSVYNKDLKTDLPLYLRMVQAQRFDGVSAIVALAEARKLYPTFVIDKFHADGAHDNYATYNLLHEWDIKAFIPLNNTNKDNFKYPKHINVDDKGTPICMAGNKMVNWGFNKNRCRIKYRCPLAVGKVKSCSCKEQCSPSKYGRCIYIKPSWDLRLFTVVPRSSDDWKQEMNTRTTCERVNKRILNDYGLEASLTRGKKRLFWRSVIHSVNIILDARLKASGFSFITILEKMLAIAA